MTRRGGLERASRMSRCLAATSRAGAAGRPRFAPELTARRARNYMLRMQRAPEGKLESFVREHFAHGDFAHDIYRKGHGPAVLELAEIPGLTPHVLGFADRVAALGCTAVLPDLFGVAGFDADALGQTRFRLYMAKTTLKLCVRREFNVFAAGRSSRVVDYLRALAAREHERCGGPGVGVVGMCFTGGYALAMAADPRVLAPVLSQPSLPFGFSSRKHAAVDCDPDDFARVKERCGAGLTLLGLRFRGDPMARGERFAFLREQLGAAFVGVELPQSAGHPKSLFKPHHSVLTRDLIDEPGQPTYEALQQVLALLQTKLLNASTPQPHP
jgi:hypothetical protein